ncbi:SLAIN motif-containing protein 1a isoform X2 [Betta splendens]|uniref:SLAIN motif-containing protein 1a isoform X2 n=1 Tax=Betta splendens TaxID=158456 RepID=A0A6P7LC68_BETSP|nr:SLAIN motif-containing protein 1a isoform X2 [Betta splendens]
MDAEVSSPRRMADVNGNSKISSAELEVIKLQELVRRLEKQNEQLRTRANAVNNRAAGPHPQTPLACARGAAVAPGDGFAPKYGLASPTRSHPCAAGVPGSPDEPIAYFQPSSASPDLDGEDGDDAGAATVLDEVETLDLDAVISVGEAESWLYVSPKARLQGHSVPSALQWCRQVLDHPGPEVELAKMTFCHRLDQAPLPSSGQSFLQSTFPLRPSCSLGDRAPTFLSTSALHNAGRRHATISPQSSLDSEVGVSELEDDSISMSYKLQDMTDVEVMARLQEESLRQDYASTSATVSRRSSTFSLHSLRRSEMDLEEEDEEDEGYDQLPPPQPRLFRTASMQRGGLPHSHTFSSMRDCRSSLAAPQFSLSGLPPSSGPSGVTTETYASYRNSADKLRRSMPNLIQTPSMPSAPSIPCLAVSVNPPSHGPSSLPMISSLRSSQSFDSSNGLARLQSCIPSPGQLRQRVQSVGNFPTNTRQPIKATAYVSPTVQQSPAPSPLSTSTSLHSVPGSAALPQPLKPSSSFLSQPLKAGANQPAAPRSSLPRPASFIGTTGVPRASKVAQAPRSLLTPPKSLAALSALRDGSWKDGCY